MYKTYLPSVHSDRAASMLRGVAMRPRTLADAEAFGPWWYDYRPKPKHPLPGAAFVPMYRAWNTAQREQFGDGVAGYLLALNEPDIRNQDGQHLRADAVQHSAELCARLRAANPAAYIVGPNVSQHAQGDWLTAFARAGGVDALDALGIHFYAFEPNWRDALRDLLVQASSFGKPIWFTEYGLSGYIQPHELVQAMHDMLQLFAAFNVRARFHFGVEYWIAHDGAVPAHVPLVVYPNDGDRRVTAVGEAHAAGYRQGVAV